MNPLAMNIFYTMAHATLSAIIYHMMFAFSATFFSLIYGLFVVNTIMTTHVLTRLNETQLIQLSLIIEDYDQACCSKLFVVVWDFAVLCCR